MKTSSQEITSMRCSNGPRSGNFLVDAQDDWDDEQEKPKKDCNCKGRCRCDDKED